MGRWGSGVGGSHCDSVELKLNNIWAPDALRRTDIRLRRLPYDDLSNVAVGGPSTIRAHSTAIDSESESRETTPYHPVPNNGIQDEQAKRVGQNYGSFPT